MDLWLKIYLVQLGLICGLTGVSYMSLLLKIYFGSTGKNYTKLRNLVSSFCDIVKIHFGSAGVNYMNLLLEIYFG